MEKGEFTTQQGNKLMKAQTVSDHENSTHPPPTRVLGNDYFWQCIGALGTLLEEYKPPEVVVRSTEGLILIYG